MDERLDQRLGDFAPLRRPVNQIELERLFDRYGIALVCDYPQILFEHRDQMRFPGWWYREIMPDYLNTVCTRLPYASYRHTAEQRGLAVGEGMSAHWGSLARLCDAYRVLDTVFSPSPKADGYPRGSNRQPYGKTDRRGYS